MGRIVARNRFMSGSGPIASVWLCPSHFRFSPNSGGIANIAALRIRANDRDRGEPRGSAPPTPPYVRVRIRRFEKNANALRSNDSTRVGWAFGFIHHRERFDVFPQRLPGFMSIGVGLGPLIGIQKGPL